MASTKEQEVIQYYFYSGLKYKDIVIVLSEHHGIHMSVRTLKRRLKEYDLTKHGVIAESVLRSIIRKEIQGPSSCLGYRGMWHLLRNSYNIQTPRDHVMHVLKDEDPAGTERRKAHKLKRRNYFSFGANYCWHSDGYDKLKPYGLPIHGAIDGFSRRVIWLNVCRTNNNPVIVASFYLKAVKNIKCIPSVLRTDHGTENGIMAAAQCTLAQDKDAHRWGTSVANQRIENFWSHFRRGFADWLIDFFKSLVEDGKLELGNYFHKQCVWFSFSGFLQSELNGMVENWNSHYIRSAQAHCIPGIPNQMFSFPERFGYLNCGKNVTEQEINSLTRQNDFEGEAEIILNNEEDDDLLTYFRYVVRVKGLPYPPVTWQEAKLTFETIIEKAG